MVDSKEVIFDLYLELFSEISQHVDFAGKKVLDFGSGNGEGVVALSLRGIDIIGIDNDQAGYNTIPRAIQYAKEKGARVDFHLMDGEKMSFKDQSFDIVLLIDVLEHITAPAKVFAEIARVLKPGGKFVIIWQPYYAPYGGHLRFYSKNPWRQLMPFFNKEDFLKKACAKSLIGNSYEQEMAVQHSLNKLTLRGARKIIADFPFNIELFKKRPFKVNAQVTGMGAEVLIRKFFNRLPMLPVLEEFTTQSVLIILDKK